MEVEVAYATPKQQVIETIIVPDAATVRTAIKASTLLQRFPEIDLDTAKVGIFSKRATLDTPLNSKDRVEIYRPLTIDPKLARRLRAKSA